MKEAGNGRKKNIRSRDSHEFSPNHVPFPAGQRLHFPGSLVGRYDRVTRWWPNFVSRRDVCSSQVWSIKTSEISLFLSLAHGEMERVLPRAWRREEPQDGSSLGP